MNARDFSMMYPEWERMPLEERVARIIAFRAWEPPPRTSLATSGAMTKCYTDEHWQEYVQTAAAIIHEVRGAG
jgi:hypothetical protein